MPQPAPIIPGTVLTAHPFLAGRALRTLALLASILLPHGCTSRPAPPQPPVAHQNAEAPLPPPARSSTTEPTSLTFAARAVRQQILHHQGFHNSSLVTLQAARMPPRLVSIVTDPALPIQLTEDPDSQRVPAYFFVQVMQTADQRPKMFLIEDQPVGVLLCMRYSTLELKDQLIAKSDPSTVRFNYETDDDNGVIEFTLQSDDTLTFRVVKGRTADESNALASKTYDRDTLRRNLLDSAVAESAIRGEHLFEWAEAVAYARTIDATGGALVGDITQFGSLGMYRHRDLMERFMHDVTNIDGPKWDKAIAPGTIAEARKRVYAREHGSEFAVRAALAQLNDPDESKRLYAIAALADSRREGGGFLGLLAPHLKADRTIERIATAKALGAFTPTHSEAVDLLAPALSDPDPAVRNIAASAIANATTIPPNASALVASAMNRKNRSDIRESIVRALVKCDRDVPEVAAALAAAANDPDPVVRRIASATLSRPDVQSAASTSSLIAALRDPDPKIRRDAAHALRQRKIDADPILDALTTAVDHGNFIVREALADALDRAEKDHTTALQALQSTADTGPTPTAKAYARAALKQIQPAKPPANKPRQN